MTTETLPLLTHSSMAAAKSCLRRYQYSYVLGIRRAHDEQPLRMGSAFHLGAELLSVPNVTEEQALAAVQKATAGYEIVPDWVQEPLDWSIEAVTVQRLLMGYWLRYQNDGLETVKAEIEYDLPLVNPETGYPSQTFRLAGKIDRIVKLPDGRLAVLETKTTGGSIQDGADYWERLRLDSQISLYVYAARQLGYDVSTVLYDVVRKPLLDVRRATPQEARKYTKTGALYANQRDRDETPEEYAERLSADLAERPDFYFARREIARLEADIQEAQAEWWQQAQMLRDCTRLGRWFRNTNSCLHPYRCEFAELCFSGARPEEALPPGFKRVENLHPELKGTVHGSPTETAAANASAGETAASTAAGV